MANQRKKWIVSSTYLGLQVAADGGYEMEVVHRMNQGYEIWRPMKSVLSNRGLAINVTKCLQETLGLTGFN